jgi:Fatty acid desaturase
MRAGLDDEQARRGHGREPYTAGSPRTELCGGLETGGDRDGRAERGARTIAWRRPGEFDTPYQVEHHLFPDMSSSRYAEIAPRVKDLCERYSLPYNTGPLFKHSAPCSAPSCASPFPAAAHGLSPPPTTSPTGARLPRPTAPQRSPIPARRAATARDPSSRAMACASRCRTRLTPGSSSIGGQLALRGVWGSKMPRTTVTWTVTRSTRGGRLAALAREVLGSRGRLDHVQNQQQHEGERC